MARHMRKDERRRGVQGTDRASVIACTACLAFLAVMCLSIMARAFTREVVAGRLGIRSELTQLVWFDVRQAGKPTQAVDWEAEYPFTEDVDAPGEAASRPAGTSLGAIYEVARARVEGFEESVETYATDHIMGRARLRELARGFELSLGWHNSQHPSGATAQILDLGDGQLYTPYGPYDTLPLADSLSQLGEFCEEHGADLLYVQVPTKVCDVEDPGVSGVSEFSIQNASELLRLLDERGVATVDLHTLMHQDDMNHHEQFFLTDHHWKPECALWAMGHVVRALRDDLGYDVDPGTLDAENYRYEVLPDEYLGEFGRQLTLLQTSPEDISLIYPEFDTHVRFVLPELDVDEEGDISVTYLYDLLEGDSCYVRWSYAAYVYGNRSYEWIENLDAPNDLRVLVLHDSNACPGLPFFSLCVAHTDLIDLRYFNGSLRAFIDETRPDVVIVMYGALSLYDHRGDAAHANPWDFG